MRITPASGGNSGLNKNKFTKDIIEKYFKKSLDKRGEFSYLLYSGIFENCEFPIYPRRKIFFFPPPKLCIEKVGLSFIVSLFIITTMTDEEQNVPLFTIGFKMDERGSLVMDTFHVYDDFIKLPLEMQHELINGAMEELGESPGYTGRGFKSLQ